MFLLLLRTSHLNVGHGRHRGVNGGGGGGHGEERGDGERHPGRGCVVVQPEGHPGDADDHECRNINGDDVV